MIIRCHLQTSKIFIKILPFTLMLSLALMSNQALAIDISAATYNIRVAHIEVKNKAAPAYYYQQALILALDKTKEKYGDYALTFFKKAPTFTRLKKMVEVGKSADIIWASVTPEREKRMQVIPVDLLRGFNNYRLLLIAKHNQDAFKDIKSLTDFKKLSAGNGHNWTDSRILKGNGIEVTTNVRFHLLIKMLLADRFDYISRGLHEIDTDMDMFSHTDLTVEQHLVLKYKYPITYSFFVTRTNKALAERVKLGLDLAIADGSFSQLFESIPSFKIGIQEMEKHRIEIELDNSLAVNKSE